MVLFEIETNENFYIKQFLINFMISNWATLNSHQICLPYGPLLLMSKTYKQVRSQQRELLIWITWYYNLSQEVNLSSHAKI